MNTEYEIKFSDINKDEMRDKLKKFKAKLVRPEFLQTRYAFHLPRGLRKPRKWIRVRDEGDKITMAFKAVIDRGCIEGQKEIDFTVSDFKKASDFLVAIGCDIKAYQESKREIWMLDGVEITIDEWPFLEPFIEIEGSSKEVVEKAVDKLGFDYNKGVFGGVAALYKKKYGISIDRISNHTPKIVFKGENPFL